MSPGKVKTLTNQKASTIKLLSVHNNDNNNVNNIASTTKLIHDIKQTFTDIDTLRDHQFRGIESLLQGKDAAHRRQSSAGMEAAIFAVLW